jgi:hypothetical protein
MAKWTKFPYPEKAYQYTADALKKNWSSLHIGDAEPYPKDAAEVEAWRLFHCGEFESAKDAGLAACGAGVTVTPRTRAVTTHMPMLRGAIRSAFRL